MDYYCDVGDKAIKIKPKRKIFQSLSQNEFKYCIRVKHTISNPDFFVIDKRFIKYITNHIEKSDLRLVECDFKLAFEQELHPHFKSD